AGGVGGVTGEKGPETAGTGARRGARPPHKLCTSRDAAPRGSTRLVSVNTSRLARAWTHRPGRPPSDDVNLPDLEPTENAGLVVDELGPVAEVDGALLGVAAADIEAAGPGERPPRSDTPR